MGGSASKPEQHIFNADTPVRFSQSVVDSLQNSPETDSTRAKDLELKIQQRVNSELQRIRDSQASKLSSLTASLTTDAPTEGASASDPQRDRNTLAYHLSSPFYQDYSTPSSATGSPKSESNRTHDSVQMEVMDLRQKLESRKKLDKVSPEVEKAKEQLVTCLRTNDRRPLDCWQEVENFKAEVGKLEKAFIEKQSR